MHERDDPTSTHTPLDLATVGPLPARMRPRNLDEYVGQSHLLGPRGPLRAMIEQGSAPSMLLWGPPGTGKTTLASLAAEAIDADFVSLSAINAGVADVRATIEQARTSLLAGRRTLVFLDEIHRFDKRQQDAFLAAVEDGLITLVGATTESPYASINPALLSRMRTFRLEPLTDDELRTLIARAIADPRGLGGRFVLRDDAQARLLELGAGDGRRTLDILDTAALISAMPTEDVFAADAPEDAPDIITIDLLAIETAAQRSRLDYDASGVMSAFIKSIRGNDPDAALYWLATMLIAGEDPKVIARRMVISAGEDIGAADPRGLSVATAAATATTSVGMPEIQYVLATATALLAGMPKSPRAGQAYFAARDEIERHGTRRVPSHLRAMSRAYDHPHRAADRGTRPFHVDQQYLPDELRDATFYDPSEVGVEGQIRERLKRLKEKP